MAEEFTALGADFDARGSLTDEHILVLRAFWRGPDPLVSGRHYQVSGVSISPLPIQRPGPPIWTGGISVPALRRAALLSDGWHGIRQTPAEREQVSRSVNKKGTHQSRYGKGMDRRRP